MAKVPRFEVVSLTPVNTGALKALARVRIANMITLNECRLIINGAAAPWVSLPQQSWTDDTGKRRFSTLVELHEKSWREALTACVLDAYREFPDGIRAVEVIQQRPPTFGQAVREKAGVGGAN